MAFRGLGSGHGSLMPRPRHGSLEPMRSRMGRRQSEALNLLATGHGRRQYRELEICLTRREGNPAVIKRETVMYDELRI